LLLRRCLLWIRGLNFREREAGNIPPKDLAKIDICWSAGVGLILVDPIRGADFQARGLLLALRAGEPDRIARLLALNAINVAMAGAPGTERAERLVRRPRALPAGSIARMRRDSPPQPRGSPLASPGVGDAVSSPAAKPTRS